MEWSRRFGGKSPSNFIRTHRHFSAQGKLSWSDQSFFSTPPNCKKLFVYLCWICTWNWWRHLQSFLQKCRYCCPVTQQSVQQLLVGRPLWHATSPTSYSLKKGMMKLLWSVSWLVTYFLKNSWSEIQQLLFERSWSLTSIQGVHIIVELSCGHASMNVDFKTNGNNYMAVSSCRVSALCLSLRPSGRGWTITWNKSVAYVNIFKSTSHHLEGSFSRPLYSVTYKTVSPEGFKQSKWKHLWRSF